MRKDVAADGVGGDDVDNLVIIVFFVWAFVKDLSKCCGVLTGALTAIVFGGLGPVVFGGSISSLVDIGFVIVPLGCDNFESTVFNKGVC